MLTIWPGLPPNRGSVERLVPGDRVDEAGRVRVDSCLRVEGTTNIFAVGDCCNTQGGQQISQPGVMSRGQGGNLDIRVAKLDRHYVNQHARPF